ncbi:hypothetical protein PsYK624_136320 [Phanerochaete sordida]|uniref:Uncharacterized protein n=1 Tax=Phanerochaete sordida TaxID=48140 RepID=A0A9P3GLC4_9APHY|nr:hypothetical protein PsYK624_136320 [Phanerochaete sordida]
MSDEHAPNLDGPPPPIDSDPNTAVDDDIDDPDVPLAQIYRPKKKVPQKEKKTLRRADGTSYVPLNNYQYAAQHVCRLAPEEVQKHRQTFSKFMGYIWRRLSPARRRRWKKDLKDARERCRADGHEIEGRGNEYPTVLDDDDIVPPELLKEATALFTIQPKTALGKRKELPEEPPLEELEEQELDEAPPADELLRAFKRLRHSLAPSSSSSDDSPPRTPSPSPSASSSSSSDVSPPRTPSPYSAFPSPAPMPFHSEDAYWQAPTTPSASSMEAFLEVLNVAGTQVLPDAYKRLGLVPDVLPLNVAGPRTIPIPEAGPWSGDGGYAPALHHHHHHHHPIQSNAPYYYPEPPAFPYAPQYPVAEPVLPVGVSYQAPEGAHAFGDPGFAHEFQFALDAWLQQPAPDAVMQGSGPYGYEEQPAAYEHVHGGFAPPAQAYPYMAPSQGAWGPTASGVDHLMAQYSHPLDWVPQPGGIVESPELAGMDAVFETDDLAFGGMAGGIDIGAFIPIEENAFSALPLYHP